MIAMRLTVIGCAGSYPGPDAATSCYLVEADEPDGRTWRILLDLGSGALGPLQRFTDPFGIDAVFISHLHADHCLDLCGYHVLRRYHPDGVQPPIPTFGLRVSANGRALAYSADTGPCPGLDQVADGADLLLAEAAFQSR